MMIDRKVLQQAGPDIMTEENLGALLSFIRGEMFPHWGPGIYTYPLNDPDHKHKACLELEKRGLIQRHWEDEKQVVWKPV